MDEKPVDTAPEGADDKISFRSEGEPVEQPIDASVFDNSAEAEEPVVTWTASEFIAHDKTPLWYVALVVVALAATGITYLLTHDITTSVVIFLAGVVLAYYGGRKPRQLKYALSSSGLLVANHYFPYDDFRSFALLDEGVFGGIVLTPMRRFGQLVTIYFDVADKDRIMEVLSTRLPLEHRSPDRIDQLMRRIRF